MFTSLPKLDASGSHAVFLLQEMRNYVYGFFFLSFSENLKPLSPCVSLDIGVFYLAIKLREDELHAP
jgi:hypothetical protein